MLIKVTPYYMGIKDDIAVAIECNGVTVDGVIKLGSSKEFEIPTLDKEVQTEHTSI